MHLQNLLEAREGDHDEEVIQNIGQNRYQNNENINIVSQKQPAKEAKPSNEAEAKKERIFNEISLDELNHTGNPKEYSKNENKIVAEKPTPINQNVHAAQEESVHIDDGNEDYSLVFLEKYHGAENENAEIVQESEGTKGKIFRLYSNEKREILFANGVRKEIFPDGYSVVYFSNDDIKQTYPDGKTVYYFADAGTAQTTLPDGLKIYKFSNSQIEKHYVDGTKEIIFPDGTVKYIFGMNDEESIFPDGTVQRVTPDGLKVVEYISGQKDIIYPDGAKERQYPSGKVKKMAPDGKVKTISS